MKISADRSKAFNLSILGLVLGIFILYLPALGAPPLSLDDPIHVLIPQLRAPFDWELLKTLWTPGSHVDFYPIRDTSYALDFQFFAHHWEGWRLNQLAFFSASAVLIIAILREFSVSRVVAFSVAAIWAFNPVHTELNLWLTARKDILQIFFTLLSTWFYVKGYKKDSTSKFALAFLFYLCGGFSKAGILPLPLIGIFSYGIGFRSRKALITLVTATLTGAALGALGIWFYSHVSHQTYPITFSIRALAASAALGRSILGWANPSLNFVDLLNWGEWISRNSHFLYAGIFICAGLLATLATGGFKKDRVLLLCPIACILLYLPVSGLVFQSRNIYSVRYTELAMLPLFVMFGILVERLRSYRTLNFITIGIGFLTVALLSLSLKGTSRDIETWASPLHVLEKGINREPDSVRLRVALLSQINSPFIFSELTTEEQDKMRSRIGTELNTLCARSQETEVQATCALFWSKEPISQSEFETRYASSTLLFDIWRPHSSDNKAMMRLIATGKGTPEIAQSWLEKAGWQTTEEARQTYWLALCLAGHTQAAKNYLTEITKQHLLVLSELQSRVSTALHFSLVHKAAQCMIEI